MQDFLLFMWEFERDELYLCISAKDWHAYHRGVYCKRDYVYIHVLDGNVS